MEQHDILARLRKLADPAYQTFQAALIPTIGPRRVLGVRRPARRRLARQLHGTDEARAFLARLPHQYYDENNLHGLLINEEKNYDAAVAALDAFLPVVDNWATCDLLSPCAFAARPAALAEQAQRWMASDHPFAVRFGVGVLLRWYLDDPWFQPEQLKWAASVCCEEYYVNMMVAWYFATALAKQYPVVLPWLQERRLPRWVHNKTIQKAVESYRITPEQKQALRALRWKE